MSGVEDFESSDDLYDAIGAILHEVSVEKSEDDIKDLCEQLLCLMKPQDSTKKNSQKVLDAPINLAQMAANLQNNSHDVTSIWVINRDDNLVCIVPSSTFRILEITVSLIWAVPLVPHHSRVESRFEEIGKGTKEIGPEAGQAPRRTESGADARAIADGHRIASGQQKGQSNGSERFKSIDGHSH